MSSKTKIVVFKAKELIYTGIFIVLGILLVCLLIYMFSSKNKEQKKQPNSSTAQSVISDGADAKISTEESMQESLEGSAEGAIQETSEGVIQETPEGTVQETSAGAIQNSSEGSAETIAEEFTEQPASQPTTDAPMQMAYQPGVYTTVMSLGGYDLAVTVTVDADRISHVDIANMDETVTAMYPLLPTALDSVNAQITGVRSIDEITYPEDQAYTTILICDAIRRALE